MFDMVRIHRVDNIRFLYFHFQVGSFLHIKRRSIDFQPDPRRLSLLRQLDGRFAGMGRIPIRRHSSSEFGVLVHPPHGYQ